MGPHYPQRKQSRLKDFDYSHSGRYFITMCTLGRADCFGHIENGIMCLNPCGELVSRSIEKIAEIYPNIGIPCKAIMPDHIHFIMEITEASTVGVAYHATRPSGKATRLPEYITRSMDYEMKPSITWPDDDVRRKSKMTIPKIVQQFKTATLKAVKRLCDETESQRLQEGWVYGDGLHEMISPLYWQRGYHDSIIRADEEYKGICKYIETNPQKWIKDEHLGELTHENEDDERSLL
jgi:putative transposase